MAVVTADAMNIASDALSAAIEGSTPNTIGDRVRILFGPSIERVRSNYQSLLESWDAGSGIWDNVSLSQWHYYLNLAHSLSGDIWDLHYTLGVRVLDVEQKMQAAGQNPNPTLVSELKEGAQAVIDKVDSTIRSMAPNVAGIGKAIMWGAIGLGIILILYAIGPALQAGATVYKTRSEHE